MDPALILAIIQAVPIVVSSLIQVIRAIVGALREIPPEHQIEVAKAIRSLTKTEGC